MGDRIFRSTDRRGALRLALAAAIAPSLASRPASAHHGIPGGLIEPPVQPMAYHRSVTRDLIDGNSFSVSRTFTLQFSRFSDGFMVEGRQSSVSVDAPTQLSEFAELEAGREEVGLFPLALDPFGLILSHDRPADMGASVQQALDRTLSALREGQLPQEELATLETFVAALHVAGQGITAHLPVDLFAPSPDARSEEQSIALPDGGLGRVVTRFGGERDHATGLMRAASREITTEVANSRRTTRESWNLSAL